MAEKKLSYNDIAEENLLEPLKKEVQDTIKLLDQMVEVLRKNAVAAAALAQINPAGNFDNFNKAMEAAKRLEKSIKLLEKAEKLRTETKKAEVALTKEQQVALEVEKQKKQQAAKEIKNLAKEQLNSNKAKKEEVTLTKEQQLEIEKVRVQNIQARKELKQLAIEALGQEDSYKKLAKESDRLQRNFKNLAAQFGVNSKQAHAARLEFEQVNNKLRAIDEASRDGRRNVGRYAESLRGLQNGLQKVGATANKTAGALGFIGLFNSLISVVKQIDTLGDGVQVAIGYITVSFTVMVERISKAAGSLGAVMDVLGLKIKLNMLNAANIFGNFDEAVVKTNLSLIEAQKRATAFYNSFDGIGEEISKLIDKNTQYVLNIGDMQRAESALIKQNAKLVKSKAELEAAANNATASFEQQIQSQIQLNEINIKILNNELKIAKNNVIQTRLQTQVKKDNAEAELAYGNAIKAVADIEATIIQEKVEGQNRIFELQRNAIRRNLDYYLSDADNQRNIAEKIIEDDTQTFERREELLQQYRDSVESNYRASTKLLNDFQASQGKAIIDFDTLLQESSEERIEQTLTEANLDKRLAKETLDVLKTRRNSLQQLGKAELTLTQARQEAVKIQQDLLIQQEALNAFMEEGADVAAIIEKAEEKRFNLAIEQQKELVKTTKEGSLERLKAEQDLNNLLIQEQDRLYQKQLENQQKTEENRKKDLENQAKYAEKSVEFIEQLTARQTELRLQAIDLQLNREQQRQNKLAALANAGNRQVEENLALSEKRQAELEAKREREIQNQKRLELGLAMVKVYAAKVAQGDSQPLASTIAESATLTAFINALPRFYEGTERVENDLQETVAGKDGYLVRVDGKERILSPSQNAAIPANLSNVELVQAAQQYREPTSTLNLGRLEAKLADVERAIRDKPTYLGRDFDQTANAVIERIQRGNKFERTHYSNRGFGNN